MAARRRRWWRQRGGGGGGSAAMAAARRRCSGGTGSEAAAAAAWRWRWQRGRRRSGFYSASGGRWFPTVTNDQKSQNQITIPVLERGSAHSRTGTHTKTGSASSRNGPFLIQGLTYGHEQHINVLKHIVYVNYGCGKQFEVGVSLNHDIMTSF